MPRAETAERLRGVVGEHQRHAGGQFIGHGIDHEAARPATHRIAQESMPVVPLAADGEEGLAHIQGAAVDRHAGHRDAEVASEQSAARAPHDLFHGKGRPTRSYVVLPARAARAWARSSKGSTSEPMI
jgi:hypothetical protein